MGECLCPPEFSGPHCEFLKALADKQNTPHTVVDSAVNDEINKGGANPPIGLGLFLCAVAVAVVMGIVVKRKRRKRGRYNSDESNEFSYDKSVFPLTPTGYHGNDEDDELGFDEEYVLQDVVLT